MQNANAKSVPNFILKSEINQVNDSASMIRQISHFKNFVNHFIMLNIEKMLHKDKAGCGLS